MMFEHELGRLEREGLLRKQVRIGSATGPSVEIDGRQVLLLCSNDYLGLAGHPALVRAAAAAMERFGFGTGASRLVSGTTDLHGELEQAIASFKGTESSIVFNTGYAANTGIIPAVAGEGDAIFSDELNHASIIDGCRLSRARTVVYRHRDLDHLEALLRGRRSRRKLIVTDGVFSMDGDIAPLPGLVDLAERHGAMLMVDDAHGTGVLGSAGRGTAEHFGVGGRVHIQMGTLGKALGSFGAYVAGDRGLIAYLMNTSRSYIFSTSLPPAVCAASLAALEVLAKEPERREHLRRNRQRMADGLAARGIGLCGSETPILPLLIGDPARSLAAAQRAFELGVIAPAIRPPSVPAGMSRIRATIMATHTSADIDRSLAVVDLLIEEGFLPHGSGS
jgi:8-amino-7-oxononanoate synthase